MTDKDVIAGIINDLRRVFKAVNEHSKKAERETGLTGPQLWAMKTIAENGPIRVSRLAELMYLHPATVVGILDRLESRNFLRRVRLQADRRVVEVQLTPLGTDTVMNSPQMAQGVLVPRLRGLRAEDLAVISAGIAKMASIVDGDDHRQVPHLPNPLQVSYGVNEQQQ